MQLTTFASFDNYNDMLEVYKDMIRKAALVELMSEHQHKSTSYPFDNQMNGCVSGLNILSEFDQFAVSCGQSLTAMTEYYRTTRWMLKKWGDFSLQDTAIRLQEHHYSVRTYNHRRTCLHKFFEWLLKKKIIDENPLKEVKNKRKGKSPDTRSPFTDQEAALILEALQLDLYKKESSRYSHRQYFPFVAFLLHVGTRNGEAIGLRIKDVDFENRKIKIEHSFSRTIRGTNVGARVLKSTKNDNIRFIPIDSFLYNLLWPLCAGRKSDGFVFVNENGNPIDDRMFQRRVWKRILEKIGVPKRDLYACRHTFATRAVRQGIKPHEVAYLMGDTVETILKTYFHNNLMPDKLPNPIKNDVRNQQKVPK